MSTNENTIYGPEQIKVIEAMIGMTVEEYNAKNAKKRADAQAAAEYERKAWEAKMVTRFENRNTSVEALAKYLVDMISTDEVTPDAWVGSGSYGEPEYWDEENDEAYGKIGVSVDGFVDTLALVKRLVSLGVIVINEDKN